MWLIGHIGPIRPNGAISTFRDGDRPLEAEGQLRFAGDLRRVAARRQDNARAGPTAGGSADRRAFTSAGYRANRRANAGADADLRRIFLLRGLGLLRVRAGRKSDLAPVSELQAAQLDRKYGPPLHPPARIGIDDFALDQRASLGDHPIAVDDWTLQASCKTIAVLVKLGGERLGR